jgi:hypothetical protein
MHLDRQNVDPNLLLLLLCWRYLGLNPEPQGHLRDASIPFAFLVFISDMVSS